MAIQVAGRTYRTLKDNLYVNGRKVTEAWADGTLVYPDDKMYKNYKYHLHCVTRRTIEFNNSSFVRDSFAHIIEPYPLNHREVVVLQPEGNIEATITITSTFDIYSTAPLDDERFPLAYFKYIKNTDNVERKAHISLKYHVDGLPVVPLKIKITAYYTNDLGYDSDEVHDETSCIINYDTRRDWAFDYDVQTKDGVWSSSPASPYAKNNAVGDTDYLRMLDDEPPLDMIREEFLNRYDEYGMIVFISPTGRHDTKSIVGEPYIYTDKKVTRRKAFEFSSSASFAKVVGGPYTYIRDEVEAYGAGYEYNSLYEFNYTSPHGITYNRLVKIYPYGSAPSSFLGWIHTIQFGELGIHSGDDLIEFKYESKD